MGFGTLFIGYFFITNISYYAYTDILSAAIMLLALYKLSSINTGFRIGFGFCTVFTVFSLAELVFTVIQMFSPSMAIAEILNNSGSVRYILIFALTVATLIGIRDVAKEVEADDIALRAKRALPLSGIFAIGAILEIESLSAILGNIAPYFYVFCVIASLLFSLYMLYTIYGAYRVICMPEDLSEKKKPKKESALSRFEKYEEEKGRQYAEYKIKRDIEKAKKNAAKKQGRK